MDLELDTLKKKPKVWSIALLSAAVLAAVIAALTLAGKGAMLWINVLIIAYYAAVIALLLRAFFRQLRWNPYSYNTIIYSGFSVFVFFVLCTHISLLTSGLLEPDQMNEARLVATLLYSARSYILITSPFLIAFSVALFVSNLSLIRHEGKRFVNILGILLSGMLLLGDGLLLYFDRRAGADRTMLAELIISLCAAGYLYFECMLIGTIVAGAGAARYETKKDKDYIIILGCGVRKDGTPSPILRGRMERAMQFAAAQEAAGGPTPVFVVSGGQGPDEPVSEAACMRDWLISQGVDGARIRVEDRSTDTAENMCFSKDIIYGEATDAKIAYATTNYHVFRAGLKARRVKMKAFGMGAPTKWYFWPNAAVREFVGLLTEHRGKQALLLIGMAAVYTVLTLIAYR